MNPTTNICPWLGTDEDRETRHLEPTRMHICYAQKRKTSIPVEHQTAYCLTGEHRTCSFYLEPPPLPRPIIPSEIEDEFGLPPDRIPALRILVWVVVCLGVVAAAFFYGSARLAPLPQSKPPTEGAPSSPLTSTSTPYRSLATPINLVASPTPAFEFLKPTGTLTPYPGGAIYSLSPEAGTVGWVASNESRGNHVGDSFMYAGVYDNVIYHGFFQFDLAAIPRGATIYAATLELTGIDDRRLGNTGVWEIRVLPRAADTEWNQHTFQTIHNAPAQWSILPALSANDLRADKAKVFQIPRDVLKDWEQRLIDLYTTVSFRIDGPLTGNNSLYAWVSGYGTSSKVYRPRLLLNVGPPPLTPYPTNTPPPSSTPLPTSTPE